MTSKAEKSMAVPASHTARPIMSVGVTLMACVVLSVVILAPSLTQGGLDLAVANPWPLAALLLLSYCIPCLASIVIVIMAQIKVARRLRYVLCALSVIGASVPACIALMACISETDSEGAYLAFLVLRGGLLGFCALLAVMGAAMGFSLPVAGGRSVWEPPRERPKRFRVVVAFAVLFWTSVVYQLVYTLAPMVVGPYAHGALTYFLDQSVAGPASAFFGASLVFAVLWRFADLPSRPWVHRLLLWVPLLIFTASLVGSCIDVVTLSGSYSLTYAAYRISGVFVLQMGLLGILCGVGVSGIEE